MSKLEDIKTMMDFYSYISLHNMEPNKPLTIGDIVYIPYLKPWRLLPEPIIGIYLREESSKCECLICEETPLEDKNTVSIMRVDRRLLTKNIEECLKPLKCDYFDALKGCVGVKCQSCDNLFQFITNKGDSFYCSKCMRMLGGHQYV